jgi:hypothetical protein
MSEWLLLEVKIALPPNCNFQSSWVNKEKPEKEKETLFYRCTYAVDVFL